METRWKQSGGTGNSGTVEQCGGTVELRRTVLLNSVEEQYEQCGGTVWWNSATIWWNKGTV